jgi:L,D-transpeptidase ErfK/SrfK
VVVVAAGAAPAPPLPRLAGTAFEYCVQRGDTLAAIAARAGVGAATIARRNGLERTATLTAGTTLRIDAIHIVPPTTSALVVNVPQRMLFVVTVDRVIPFPIAAGRPSWPTPRGAFTIDTKEVDPTWDVPVSIQAEMRRAGKPVQQRVPPSPENPLGKYWLGTSLPGIGIHGTNAPLSIHTLVTHGCIRVHPSRIGELFELISIGTAGEIVYEPLLVAVVDGRTYVEVHADAYRRAPVTVARLREMANAASAAASIDWTLAAEAVRLKEGIAVDVSAGR